VDYIKYELFLFLILFSVSAVSLEVTAYIPIYEPLSKTISRTVSGSSNIIIDRKDLKKYENIPIHDILDLESGIKSRSIYGSNSSGSKTTIDTLVNSRLTLRPHSPFSLTYMD